MNTFSALVFEAFAIEQQNASGAITVRRITGDSGRSGWELEPERESTIN